METTSADSTAPAASPRPKNRLWIWFFLTVTALTAAATVFLAWFNLQIQLTPEKLTAQRARWETERPADYEIVFTVRENATPAVESFRAGLGLEAEAPEGEAIKYHVQVREGVVVEARENERLLPRDCWERLTMEHLFGIARGRMDADRAAGRRVYLRARFEEKTGGLLEYVRRVMRSRERQEIAVTTFRFGSTILGR